MTLDALRCFCAVVESQGFRPAAELVHRSQPAVSQQLKALERETGHLLIERATCAPTPIGRLLYARARRLLDDTGSLIRELEDFDETVGGELRLGTSDTTALYFLPPFVRAFSKAMPLTRLVIVNRSSSAIAEQVSRGNLDLGIVTLPVSHENLDAQSLFEERLVLVAPRNHRLAARDHVRLLELREEPLLLLEAQTRTGGLLRDHFRREGFDPRVVLDSGSFEVIKRYVAQGIGCSFLPEIAVTPEDRALSTVNVRRLPRVRIGVIWRRGAYRGKSAQAFLDIITRPRNLIRSKHR